MAEILCPKCGQSNPGDRETCLNCKARLPSAGDDWISSLRLGDDVYREEEDQVDWPEQEEGPASGAVEAARLERIASGPLAEPRSDPESLPENPPDAAVRSEPPDWLKALMQASAEDDDPTGPEVPLDPALPAEPPVPPAEDLPDWLTELGSPDPVPDAAAQAPEGGEDLPDWLTALAGPGDFADLEPAAAGPSESADLFDEDEPQKTAPAGDKAPVSDWLAGFIDEPAKAQPAPLPEPAEAEDSQDWLAGFVDEGAPGARARMEPEKAEPDDMLPGWLTGLPEPTAVPASDLPPWLGEFAKAGGGYTGGPPPGEPLEPPRDMDASDEAELEGKAGPWEETAPEPEPGAEPEASPLEVPDWLASALGQVDVDAEEDLVIDSEAFEAVSRLPVEREAPEPEAELGDWLSRYDSQAELESDLEPEAGPEPDDTPDWLKEVNRVESGESAAQEEGIPDWLRELNEQTPEIETQAPAEEPEPDAIDWMPARSGSAAFEMMSEAEGIEEDLAPGQLPDWLRSMRPIDAAAPGVMETGQMDTGSFERVGPLAGMRGVLSAEPSAAQAGRPPSHSVKLQVTDAQQSRSNQLLKLVRSETEPQPAGRRAILSEQRVLRYLIAGLLFLSTLFANLLPTDMNDLPVKPPEMDALTPLIASLSPDSAALIALDYQPGMSGELDAAAAAVLDHIMLQGARLALVSTTPTGPALGERLVRQVQAVHGYTPGEQYVNLGYLPGGATGLQLLVSAPVSAAPVGYNDRPFWSLVDQSGASPWSQPAMRGVNGLGDFTMTLLLSDDPEMVRRWVEQAGPALRTGTLFVVSSAQAEPLVRPYFESGQIAGLVSGLRGGAAYEGFTQREGPARNAWDGVTVGTLIAVVLILGAGAYNLYLVWDQREKLRGGAAR